MTLYERRDIVLATIGGFLVGVLMFVVSYYCITHRWPWQHK